MTATSLTREAVRKRNETRSSAGKDRVQPTLVLSPAASDPIARAASPFLGGVLGQHATPPRRRAVAVWLVVVATVTWVVTVLQKLPCRYDQVGKPVDWFASMCYSDIPLLYISRGLVDGLRPYLDPVADHQRLEYPVLTGALMEFERWITVMLGAPVGPGLTEQLGLDAAIIFYDVNQVVLFALFLIAVLAQVYTTGPRAWDAMMLAASPVVVLTGLINWDMFAIALTALALMFWSRRMPVWAGILLGLAIAAKLYPVLLLGPLLLLCLRAGKLNAFLRTAAATALAWLAVNLPVMVWSPKNWLYFWDFNSDRRGDLGSIWYVYRLMTGRELEPSTLNSVNMVLLLAGCALIGVLILIAPRRPRLAQVSYLVVFVFLALNKVYSPQYALWLLPLMIMARPRWRDWIIFTAGEVAYTMAIWGHLGQDIAAGAGGDRLYWMAVLFRIACEAWIAAVIVRDVLRPEHDPVRRDFDPNTGQLIDDPGGGVLDHAPDAPRFSQLMDRMRAPSRGRHA